MNRYIPLQWSIAGLIAGCVCACGSDDGPIELSVVQIAPEVSEAPEFLALDRRALGDLAEGEGFRGTTIGSRELVKLAGAKQDFLLAIHRRSLGQRFFMSGFLDAAIPAKLPQSLGVRVVSFLEQNSRLYVLDQDDRKLVKADFPAQEIVDAFPIVDSYKGLWLPLLFPDYVVIDPDSALNGLSVVANPIATWPGQVGLDPRPFEVLTSYSRDYHRYEDGFGFRKVLTGRTSEELNPPFPETLPSQGSATVSIAVRKYQESPGFRKLPQLEVGRFFSSSPHAIPDAGGAFREFVAHWNLFPGMKPIRWELSSWARDMSRRPGWETFDAFRAVWRAIDSWNTALGFRALSLEWAPQDPASFGHDDKNFIFLDRDPSSWMSFASLRSNPNTGEMRGASIVLAGGWQSIAGPGIESREHTSKSMEWMGYRMRPRCDFDLRRVMGAGFLAQSDSPNPMPDQAEMVRRAEAMITVIVAHELGHTLGLRHNFMGSIGDSPRSVMDYLTNRDILRVASQLPLPEDVQAIRFLARGEGSLPTGPFCTDEDLWKDPDCSTYDQGPDPLQYAVDVFVNRALSIAYGTGGSWSKESLREFYLASQGLLRYIRAKRQDYALRSSLALISAVGVPVSDSVRSDPGMAWVADQALTQVLTRLYASDKLPNFITSLEPTQVAPEDPRVNHEFTQQALGVLENRDSIRSMASRRRAVTVLHRMQSAQGRLALTRGRQLLQEQLMEDNLTPTMQTGLEDLLMRVDAALREYFLD